MPPAKKRNQPPQEPITPEEDAALSATNLDLAEVDDGGLLSTITTPAEAKQESVQPDEDPLDDGEEPSMSSPGWSDWVLKQFEPDEVDERGNPNVAGLRRVSLMLLGHPLESRTRVIQTPQYVTKESPRLCPTVVEHTVTFLLNRDEYVNREFTITEAADVYQGNTEDEFLRFPTATASTRAEARCLRKALRLQRVVAAEETTEVPLEEAATNGLITPSQITFLNVMCRRNDVNVKKLINAGKNKYENIEEVPYPVAAKINQYLSELQNKGGVKPEHRGYDPDWRKAK